MPVAWNPSYVALVLPPTVPSTSKAPEGSIKRAWMLELIALKVELPRV